VRFFSVAELFLLDNSSCAISITTSMWRSIILVPSLRTEPSSAITVAKLPMKSGAALV